MPISEAYNIDCMEGMKTFPDKHFDLAVVDVEYGIGQGGKKINSKTVNSDGTLIKKYDRRNGNQIITRPKNYPISYTDSKPPEESYFWELNRISKHMIIWGANHFLDRIPFALNSPCWIVWDKVNGDTDQADCELAWTSFDTAVRKITFMWNGFTQGIGIENGRINQGNKSLCETRMHPNQKPVVLYDWIYKNYLPDGGNVIDTHLGGGSNRISAEKAGNINFTGYEIHTEHFDASVKRFNQYKAQLNLFAK
jgi:site-specific DNA-methyltransferase (adenine-specific)